MGKDTSENNHVTQVAETSPVENNHATQVVNDNHATMVSESNHATQVANASNESSHATQVINDNHSTQVAQGTQSTQLAEDNHSTQVADNNSHETQVASEENIEESGNNMIVAGDILEGGYKIKSILNENSGEATIYICEKDKKKYVAKIYKKNYKVDTQKLKKIYALNCPYLMPNIESGEVKGRDFEIMPFFKQGTVLDHIGKISDDFIKKVLVKEMNEAMHILHTNNIIHNDIKPGNIFLTDDMKHIVLGDFGISKETNGRQYVTNIGNFTQVYAAPEADETSSPKTDYFSLGMSLFHIAFGDDPFKGISDSRIRRMMLNDGLYIPEKIDMDIRGLITMLIKYNPSERIVYEGVNKWLKNNQLYNDAISTPEKNGHKIKNLTKAYEFNEKPYKTYQSLADAISKDWERGLKHLNNGLVEVIYADAVELKIKIKAYAKDHTPDEVLFKLLHTMDQDMGLNYQGRDYKDIVGYLKFLRDNYKKKKVRVNVYEKLMMPKAFLLEELDKEEVPQELAMFLRAIISSKETYTNEIVDLLCTATDENGYIYCREVVYKDIKEYAKALFDGTDVLYSPILHTELFVQILERNFKLSREELNKESPFGINGNLAKMVLGYIPMTWNGMEIKTLDDFIIIARDLYEKHEDLTKFNKVLSDHTISNYCSYYNDVNKEEINLIKEYETAAEKANVVEAFYFNTTKGSKFKYKNNYFATIDELAKQIATIGDYDLYENDLYNNKSFRNWVVAKGGKLKEKNKEYTSLLEILKANITPNGVEAIKAIEENIRLQEITRLNNFYLINGIKSDQIIQYNPGKASIQEIKLYLSELVFFKDELEEDIRKKRYIDVKLLQNKQGELDISSVQKVRDLYNTLKKNKTNVNSGIYSSKIQDHCFNLFTLKLSSKEDYEDVITKTPYAGLTEAKKNVREYVRKSFDVISEKDFAWDIDYCRAIIDREIKKIDRKKARKEQGIAVRKIIFAVFACLLALVPIFFSIVPVIEDIYIEEEALGFLFVCATAIAMLYYIIMFIVEGVDSHKEYTNIIESYLVSLIAFSVFFVLSLVTASMLFLHNTIEVIPGLIAIEKYPDPYTEFYSLIPIAVIAVYLVGLYIYDDQSLLLAKYINESWEQVKIFYIPLGILATISLTLGLYYGVFAMNLIVGFIIIGLLAVQIDRLVDDMSGFWYSVLHVVLVIAIVAALPALITLGVMNSFYPIF